MATNNTFNTKNGLTIGNTTVIAANGVWVGAIDNPIETVATIKMFRRNGLIPAFTSVSFNYENNEIFLIDCANLSAFLYKKINEQIDIF